MIKKPSNIIKRTVLIFVISFTLYSVGLVTLFGAEGNWTSSTKYDLDGVSSVSTIYTGGAGSAVTVDLYIKYQSGANVGKLYTAARVDQKVSHTAIGTPFTYRYGQVKISGYHSPAFNQ